MAALIVAILMKNYLWFCIFCDAEDGMVHVRDKFLQHAIFLVQLGKVFIIV